MKTYDFYSDPSHGWLKVDFSELERLGIANKISTCSYTRGITVYLEEDMDMTTFINAVGKENIKIREHRANKSSKIRSYASYKPGTRYYIA